MKATDKEAATAVQAACDALPAGCEVLLVVASPEERVGAGVYQLTAYSNTHPTLARQLYTQAEPLFAGENATIIQAPGLDS